ncbi:PfkB family carbohydrate kinase, partial [Tropicimonas sp. IMCC34043]|uniref:PfkB family carbohydrate kinase n=1 Tax=Tropicimonas sp. IMCC34043 TaxID=2248760 RepID=UPI001E658A9F
TTNAAAVALTPQVACAAIEAGHPGDMLVLQGNLSAETTAALVRRARDLGLVVTINPSPLQPYFDALLPLAQIVFLNAGEAELTGGTARLRQAGVAQVVLTRGPQGAVLVDAAGTTEVAAVPADPVDTTGAGDCFLGVALASAGLRGVPLDARALRHAAAAAALTVMRPGTVSAFPTPQEMREILKAP